MSLITKGYVPSNTRKQTDWAVHVFSEWRRQRNESDKSSQCLADLFEVPDLNYWLPRFIAEVRNSKGEPYPPKTIQNILAGLQRVSLL